MPKLHIVGITDDHRGLVLSERARSKTGDLLLDINDALMGAISEARRLRLATETNALVSNALPTRRDEMDDPHGRGASRLSPREMQRRLRMGESIASVARRAGVDEAWVERFAPPVEAEQARVIGRVRGLVYLKPRLGPSSAPLGESVLANVFDRGVPLTIAESEDGWSAFQRRDNVWCIRFTYTSRGRRQTGEWDYFADSNELVTRNRLAAELSYLDARQRRRRRPFAAESEAEATPARPAAKRTAAKRTGRKAAVKKKAPAKKKAVTKKAVKKKAVVRKAAAVKKRPPVKKRAVAKRAPVKKRAVAKRAPVKKRVVAKRAPAKKRVVAKRAPAKRAVKRTPAKRAPVRRTATKRAPAKKRVVAKRAPAKRVAARRTASRRTPAKRGTARAAKRAHTTARPLVVPRSSPRAAKSASAPRATRRAVSRATPRAGGALDVGDW